MGTHWCKIHYFSCPCSSINCRHFCYRRIKESVKAVFVISDSEEIFSEITLESAPQINCIDLNAESEMIQTPMRCLDKMDTTLLILSAISVVGVVFGIAVVYKYGHKVFNQSHSSGRDATTFMAREMRKMNESREALPIEDHITRSLPRLDALGRRDTITRAPDSNS